jgi:hypothetical protein
MTRLDWVNLGGVVMIAGILIGAVIVGCGLFMMTSLGGKP